MKSRFLIILPLAWALGIAAYGATQMAWPWTAEGKLDAVQQARIEGNVAEYKSAIAELREAAPSMAALEQYRHGDFEPNRLLDREKLLQVALADPATRRKALLVQADMLLNGDPAQRRSAIKQLESLADQGSERAMVLLAKEVVDETDDAELARIPSSPRTASGMEIAAQMLTIAPRLALSPYQSRDLKLQRRRALERDVRQGKISSAISLAKLLAEPTNPERERKRAIGLLEDAAQKGSLRAQVELGIALRDDPGSLRNTERSAMVLRNAMKRGSVSAIYEMGETYRMGLGVPADPVKAIAYYKRAAAEGSTGAMYRIGRMYIEGTGAEMRPELALQWFRRAAEAGSASGLRELGIAYLEGKGVARDKPRGARLIEQAAKLGNTASMAKLAKIYDKGDGVERDHDKARYWALRAIALGSHSTLAATALADSAQNKFDIARAREVLLTAMYRGNAKAHRELAKVHLSFGGEQNEQLAHALLQEAASRGDAASMAMLGSLYASGNGVPIDAEKSLLYYTMAANGGDPVGLRGLGIAYASGFGVRQDMKKSVRYYEMAAEMGDTRALAALANCYLKGCLGVRDAARAATYYRAAAEDDDTEANYQYGLLVLEGQIPGGQAAAIEALKEAARSYHDGAHDELARLGITDQDIFGHIRTMDTEGKLQ